jgi:tRNA(Arg) A34 adenosine deaminase TadA/ribosomal protein S18 acetylase RimI-like enzyme
MRSEQDDDMPILLREAIQLAEEAQRRGNLPIGAVIVLDGKVVASGMNSIWRPQRDLTRHAEMEALRAVPAELWSRSREMTLFTTLEPCVMCAGAILLHRLGVVVFGSTDPYGGVGACLRDLPPYFREELSLVRWTGPALPAECDRLYLRARELERAREIGMDITLRAAATDDADFLYRLHRAAMQNYVAQTWGQWDEAWQAQYFQQHFDPSACQIIVLHGQDVGVLSVLRRVTDIFLVSIELLPACQGQGIGTHLIRTLMDEAHQQGVPLTLQVLKVNPARRLYERLGFSISGETPTHYQMSVPPGITI